MKYDWSTTMLIAELQNQVKHAYAKLYNINGTFYGG